jgi:hypothetical protein
MSTDHKTCKLNQTSKGFFSYFFFLIKKKKKRFSHLKETNTKEKEILNSGTDGAQTIIKQGEMNLLTNSEYTGQ